MTRVQQLVVQQEGQGKKSKKNLREQLWSYQFVAGPVWKTNGKLFIKTNPLPAAGHRHTYIFWGASHADTMPKTSMQGSSSGTGVHLCAKKPPGSDVPTEQGAENETKKAAIGAWYILIVVCHLAAANGRMGELMDLNWVHIVTFSVCVCACLLDAVNLAAPRAVALCFLSFSHFWLLFQPLHRSSQHKE